MIRMMDLMFCHTSLFLRPIRCAASGAHCRTCDASVGVQGVQLGERARTAVGLGSMPGPSVEGHYQLFACSCLPPHRRILTPLAINFLVAKSIRS